MLITKGFQLPNESEMPPKKFLLYNIFLILLIPIMSVFVTAGAYVVGLVLGIIIAVALVIVLFMYAGPIVAIIALVLFALLLGGGSAALNAVGDGIETVAAFIAMAVPAVICIGLCISMLKNARSFEEKRVQIFAIITAIAYVVAIIMFIVSAFNIAGDGESGIGYTSIYGMGMMIPSIPRLFYTIFGYKELNN